MDKFIEFTGTIKTVYTPEVDATGNLEQKLIIENVIPRSTSMSHMESTILLVVKVSPLQIGIPFKVNDPITVRGVYAHMESGSSLSRVYSTHAPTGFIRYNGKIYR